MRLLIIVAAAILACCTPPPAPVAQPKPDPTKEPAYAQTVDQLAAMSGEAARLFEAGKFEQAGAIITKGQPLLSRVLLVPEPTLEAMEAASDLDHLYGRMLLRNRHYEWARTLFRKNVLRWKHWNPQTPETARRLKLAESALAECDRRMGE